MRATLVQCEDMFYCWAASPLFYTITSCTLHPARTGGEQSAEGRLPYFPGLHPGAALCPAPWVLVGSLPPAVALLGASPPLSPLSVIISRCARVAGGSMPPPRILPSLHPFILPPRGQGKPRCWQARARFICFT